jgi:sialate O-acetylesterase
MKKKLLLIALLFPFLSSAAVRLPRIFSDNMILQREQSVPLWGWADPGEDVKIEFAGQVKSVKTDTAGKWTATLDPMSASAEPRTMRVGSLSITNVLVGDVFQVSGQSNAASSMDSCKRFSGTTEDIKNTVLPSVRMFVVPWSQFKETPQEDVPATCVWDSLRPEKNASYSAIAFYFARSLHQHLNVPIGIVRASHAGGMAQIKMPKEALLSYEGGRKFYENAVKRTKVDGGYPSSDWNGAIAPVIRYGKRGIVWYQGEHNAGSGSYGYRETLAVLLRSWREACGNPEMPFLIVQLPAFEAQGWPMLRESQLVVYRQTKNAGFVVAIDHGEKDNIHPADKKPIGERLALEARRVVYNEKVTGCGPLYDGFAVDGASIVVRFTGDALKKIGGGFMISGEDKKFVPATAVIRGNTIVVSSPDVTKPVAVRYAWESWPTVSLFDVNGLPASPFRTDEQGE